MDLTASCLAAAGVVPDPGYPLDGVDLLPVLTGQRNSNAHSIGACATAISGRYDAAVGNT